MKGLLMLSCTIMSVTVYFNCSNFHNDIASVSFLDTDNCSIRIHDRFV